jgi:hypothetical protein
MASAFVEQVIEAITTWNPLSNRRWHERDYSDLLFLHLNSSLGVAEVNRSRVVGNRRADLLVLQREGQAYTFLGQSVPALLATDAAVVIEAKLHLQTKRELDRLQAQVSDYRKMLNSESRVVVLLLGDTRPAFVRTVQSLSAESRIDDAAFRSSRQVRVVLKPFSR